MEGFTYIYDIPFYQKEKYPSEKALNYKYKGKWIPITTHELCVQTDKLAHGLYKHFPEKQNIAIYARSGTPQWNAIDFAIMKSGHISVPIHGNASETDIKHIIKDADIKVVFVQFEDQVEYLESIGIKNEITIYSFENIDGAKYYKELLVDFPPDGFANQEHDPNALATIIYTSGSTGLPKGVMLSHYNIISNIKAVISLLPINHHHTVASYLPLSHIFERVAVYVYMTVGAQLYYIEDPKTLIKHVREIRPHYMTSVPRILEKVYDNILARVKKSGPIQKRVIKWALASSKRARKTSLNPLRRLELWLCDLLVFRRWRNVLGGRLKGLVVGAAAMPKHIAYLFFDAGIKIREGYGLTETSPIVSFNRFEAGGNKFGTVGIPIPSTQVRIDEPNEEGEGEVCVKGPNVMMGYYKNERLTKEKIDAEGWFHTGDVGKFTNKRFLTITDRKKNIFKTSSGQYVAPTTIEAMLRKEELIDQAMVIGFQRPFITALIIPNFDLLKRWCIENDVHWTAPQYMVLHPKVVKLYQGIIDEINENLKRHEYIKHFHLLFEEWSVGTGEYTPTLKLKRRIILEKFSKDIDKMYG